MFETRQQRLAWLARRKIEERLSYLEAKMMVTDSLKGLLSNDGLKPISESAEKKIISYARERFGSSCYAPWLVFYTTGRGKFREGWVPDNFFQRVAVQRINGPFHMTDNARTLQNRLLGPGVLPDIAHFVSGEWRGIDGELWEPHGLVERLFGDQPEICVKTEQSSKGRGVQIIDRKDFDQHAVESLGNFVVQRVLQQSEFFSTIFPGAVATLRVTTGKLPSQRPVLLFSYLRVGRGHARAVTVNSVKAHIIDDDGAVGPFGYDSGWARHAVHPDTGFRFEGAKIPEFAALVAHCLALHDRIPQFGIIGWDAAVERNGAIQILEINTGYPGIKFSEMMVGPCLKAFNVEQYAYSAVRRKPQVAA
jgi:hypothetical protein